MNPMKLHGCLQELIKTLVDIDLKNYHHLHRIYQVILAELTKICVLSLVKQA